ncbi:RNA-binding protein Hfq [Burkholderia sp. 8Y]|uniref:RNA chaperone Hfq n=1 Tax=Burkholderia sp. 8Y TaxID=2653133 RepID=UPI0012EF7684|nr:RNA chaperone Hfq [Burkholderia sp. 8Y]VXC78294.1 RNA-binding protein Hfq [Burkholderia sp. 8Y]
MSTHDNDAQTIFLAQLVRERKFVWVFLLSGVKLSGQLMSFDRYVIQLASPTGTQAVFKAAVSTVSEPHEFKRDRPSEGRPEGAIKRQHRRRIQA